METRKIKKDISTVCVEADSFPNGVKAAHEKLHDWVPYSDQRRYFGISFPDPRGNILYKAAAEELKPGEIKRPGLGHFTVRRGNYLCKEIHNYMEDLPAIGNAFSVMLKNPDIDPKGYCLEWYISSKDVLCMVKLAD